MAGYIGNKAVGLNVTTGDILGDVGVGGNIDVDGISNLDVVDIDGAVNMATTALVTGVLTTTAATVFNGGFASNAVSTITTADNAAQLSLISTDADANVGPRLVLQRDSSSPADGDSTGKIEFTSDNDAGEATVFTTIRSEIDDASNGSEDGQVKFDMIVAGTQLTMLRFKKDEIVLNDGGADIDFRVESSGSVTALKVDAGTNQVLIAKATAGLTTNGAYFANVVPTAGAHFHLGIAHTNTDAANALLFLNRHSSDGNLIDFRHANTAEGTISVSGATVSYNGFAGRHESSGIATNTAVGTVVSTIDELDVYPDTQPDSDGGVMASPKAGQTRANHAKVKVSDSVGDNRVYGVVDNFETNEKVNVISVGIASVKVTGSCAGGDLLESNGDGTAKVQSDDIVRSKTIGKVTIGNTDASVKLVSCVMYCG